MKKYNMQDYDDLDYIISKLSNEELAIYVEEISRGWISDYNFTGEKCDFDNFKCHRIMDRVVNILRSEK